MNALVNLMKLKAIEFVDDLLSFSSNVSVVGITNYECELPAIFEEFDLDQSGLRILIISTSKKNVYIFICQRKFENPNLNELARSRILAHLITTSKQYGRQRLLD